MPPPSKRRKTSAVQEITFDPDARAEYLTGFHKRKQARIKHAQEVAVKREKEEKRREREDLKKRRQQELEEHVRAVNQSINMINGLGKGADQEENESGSGETDEEWGGVDEGLAKPPEEDTEYVDEDKYATVTVEAVDITRDGFATPKEDDSESEDGSNSEKSGNEEEKAIDKVTGQGSKGKKRAWTKVKPANGKPKRKKKRDFKYEGKLERKANRGKERSKNKSQAAARKARK